MICQSPSVLNSASFWPVLVTLLLLLLMFLSKPLSFYMCSETQTWELLFKLAHYPFRMLLPNSPLLWGLRTFLPQKSSAMPDVLIITLISLPCWSVLSRCFGCACEGVESLPSLLPVYPAVVFIQAIPALGNLKSYSGFSHWIAHKI